MSRRENDPLRPLTDEERRALTRVSRPRAAPAADAARARLLLSVADRLDYQQAARAAGRKSGDAVSALVARLNREGVDALAPRHGGGRPRGCGEAERGRITREARRAPTPEADGAATWSLSTPRKALRRATGGLPPVASSTTWRVPHDAGLTSQRTRAWCPTGPALRERKAGVVAVTDPDAGAKES